MRLPSEMYEGPSRRLKLTPNDTTRNVSVFNACYSTSKRANTITCNIDRHLTCSQHVSTSSNTTQYFVRKPSLGSHPTEDRTSEKCGNKTQCRKPCFGVHPTSNDIARCSCKNKCCSHDVAQQTNFRRCSRALHVSSLSSSLQALFKSANNSGGNTRQTQNSNVKTPSVALNIKHNAVTRNVRGLTVLPHAPFSSQRSDLRELDLHCLHPRYGETWLAFAAWSYLSLCGLPVCVLA